MSALPAWQGQIVASHGVDVPTVPSVGIRAASTLGDAMTQACAGFLWTWVCVSNDALPGVELLGGTGTPGLHTLWEQIT